MLLAFSQREVHRGVHNPLCREGRTLNLPTINRNMTNYGNVPLKSKICRQMPKYAEKIASFAKNLPTGDSAGGPAIPPGPPLMHAPGGAEGCWRTIGGRGVVVVVGRGSLRGDAFEFFQLSIRIDIYKT